MSYISLCKKVVIIKNKLIIKIIIIYSYKALLLWFFIKICNFIITQYILYNMLGTGKYDNQLMLTMIGQ